MQAGYRLVNINMSKPTYALYYAYEKGTLAEDWAAFALQLIQMHNRIE